MTPRTVLGLAIATVIVTCAAVWVTLQQPAAGPVRIGDEVAFPALHERPDAVAKVVITTPSGAFTLARGSDGRWVTPDRHDYPIATDQLRELIFQLADMRLVEAKTSRPERYARLEVEDVGKDAKSRLVRLEDADGAVLAEAILGKRRQRLTGTEPSGIYLRRPDDAQSWLASGGVDVEDKVQDWLAGEIVALDADKVRRIEISPASGEAYAVLRDAPGAEPRLEGLAEGETLKKDANLKQLPGALAAVRLEDVQAASEIDWPDQETTVRVTTFDGLELTLHLASLDKQHWLRLETAAVEQPPSGQPNAGAQAEVQDAPAPAVEQAEGGEPGQAGAQAAQAGAQPEAAGAKPEEQAEAIKARTDGWAYQVSDFLFGRLTKPRKDWIEDAGTS